MTTHEHLHSTPGAAIAADPASEGERLARRLSDQLQQLRQALMARPWQAPALKEITRLLESASRAAFADETVWGCVSHGVRLPEPALGSLRPGGMRRAGHLIAQASQRLAVLSAE